MNKIAVIGSGANALATAAYLIQQGNDVVLCDTEDQLSEVAAVSTQGIRVCGAIAAEEEALHPTLVTTDFKRAVSGVEYVIVCVSAIRHTPILNLLKDALQEGQTVLFNPGNLGSVILSRMAPSLLDMPGLILAELGSCLWACRLTGEAEVTVALPVSAKKMAAYPAEKTEEAFARVAQILPVEKATNVIEGALNSPNVITHLCGTIFNVAQVERETDEFAFFRRGMSDTVVNIFSKLEEERNAVLERAGLQIYSRSSEGFMRLLMDENAAPQFDTFRSLKGPSSMAHRYMAEDALCGVALLVSLAKHCGMSVPLTESFLTIASAINGRDYAKEGYTLENLGIQSL